MLCFKLSLTAPDFSFVLFIIVIYVYYPAAFIIRKKKNKETREGRKKEKMNKETDLAAAALVFEPIKPYFSYAKELKTVAPVVSYSCALFGI